MIPLKLLDAVEPYARTRRPGQPLLSKSARRFLEALNKNPKVFRYVPGWGSGTTWMIINHTIRSGLVQRRFVQRSHWKERRLRISPLGQSVLRLMSLVESPRPKAKKAKARGRR